MRYFTSRITPNVTGEKHSQPEQGETSGSVWASVSGRSIFKLIILNMNICWCWLTRGRVWGEVKSKYLAYRHLPWPSFHFLVFILWPFYMGLIQQFNVQQIQSKLSGDEQDRLKISLCFCDNSLKRSDPGLELRVRMLSGLYLLTRAHHWLKVFSEDHHRVLFSVILATTGLCPWTRQ